MKNPHAIYKLILVLVFSTCGRLRADTFGLTSVDAALNSQDQTSFTFTVDPTQDVSGYSLGDYFQTVATSDAYGQFYAAFGNTSYAANLGIFGDFGIFYFTGEQLYLGAEDNPTSFLAGTYDLTSFDGTGYTLAIAPGSAATPEPSTLLLLSSGLAFIGTVRRRTCDARRHSFCRTAVSST